MGYKLDLIQQLLANFVITLAFVKYVLMPLLKFIVWVGSISFFSRLDDLLSVYKVYDF